MIGHSLREQRASSSIRAGGVDPCPAHADQRRAKLGASTTMEGILPCVLSVVAAAVALMGPVAPSSGQCQRQKLVAEGQPPFGQFGTAIAMDGDMAVIGARYEARGTIPLGAAYVFEFDGTRWTQTARLVQEDSTSIRRFGASVALQGDVIAIGAPNSDIFAPGPGTVFVYRRVEDQWQLEQRLAPGSGGSGVGSALNLSGDRLAVNGPSSRSIWLYRHTGSAWVFEQRLAVPPVAEGNSNFGARSMEGSVLAATGIVRDDRSRFVEASVLVFRRHEGHWTLEQTLPSPTDVDIEFGEPILIHDGRILFATSLQQVLVYEQTSDQGWMQTSVLEVDGLGQSMAHADGTLAFATTGESVTSCKNGSVSLYQDHGAGWTCINRLVAAGVCPRAQFGRAIHAGEVLATNGRQMLVGAIWDRTDSVTTGAVYAFDVKPRTADCNDNGVDDACEIASGADRDCDANGQLDSCDLASGAAFDRNHNGALDVCDPPELVVPRELASLSQESTVYDVAFQGNLAVVGAPFAQPSDDVSGAAFVYRRIRGQWRLDATLTGDPEQLRDRFGYAVAVQGSTLFVGAPRAVADDGTFGAVHVYRRMGGRWREIERLRMPATRLAEEFGVSLDVFGDTLAVGSPGSRAGGGIPGSVYLFRRAGMGWRLETALKARESSRNSFFGVSVAIEGYQLLVGDHEYFASEWRYGGPGSVVTFQRKDGTWVEGATLRSTNGSSRELFGASVDISSGVAVVGVPVRTGRACQEGAAHVYAFIDGHWVERTVLAPFDHIESSGFGTAVAIDHDVIAVGAWGRSWSGAEGESFGGTYFFETSTGNGHRKVECFPRRMPA